MIRSSISCYKLSPHGQKFLKTRKKHLRCLSYISHQRKSPTMQKVSRSMASSLFLPHFISKCLPSSQWIPRLALESLSICEEILLFFLNRKSHQNLMVVHCTCCYKLPNIHEPFTGVGLAVGFGHSFPCIFMNRREPPSLISPRF